MQKNWKLVRARRESIICQFPLFCQKKRSLYKKNFKTTKHVWKKIWRSFFFPNSIKWKKKKVWLVSCKNHSFFYFLWNVRKDRFFGLRYLKKKSQNITFFHPILTQTSKTSKRRVVYKWRHSYFVEGFFSWNILLICYLM